MSGKPPYRVPLLSEIKKLKPNGLNLVSTFSGCGGSCLGFRMAGFKTLWASEFIERAREAYIDNHPKVPISPLDIRKVTAEDILSTVKRKKGEVDVLEGSPPCASFSLAGARNDKWGKVESYSETKQRTDDLFFEFIRLIDGIQPKVFIAENVTGLIQGKAKGYFKEIYRAMDALNYRIEAKVLDASWLGVPQTRKRLIFMGVRDDLKRDPVYPKPFSYRYTLREILPDDPGDLEGTDLSYLAQGREWKKLKLGQSSDKYKQLIRSKPEAPVGTLCASSGGSATITHPFECRRFSVAELKRIQSFPDDFKLTGHYRHQVERLGRSVPPLMMKAIAETIRDKVLMNGHTPRVDV